MRQELTELNNILDLLKKIKNIIKQQESNNFELITELLNSIDDVNTEIYGNKYVFSLSFDLYQNDTNAFFNKLDEWFVKIEREIQLRRSFINKTDYDFHLLSVHIETMEETALVEEAVKTLEQIRQNQPQHYEAIKNSYALYNYFWGEVDLDTGCIDLINNRVHELKNHWNDFCWLYENLEDYRSKKVLYGILNHWLTFDFTIRNAVKEANYDDYYDYDILKCDHNEVFVDLGAWNGDSALSFIENYGEYKKIYCYEMTSNSIEEARQKLEGFENVIFRQVAVGNTTGMVNMNSFGDSSSNVIMENGNLEIPMVRLDDDIKETITFIKMDIEGSELEAMKGAKKHICNDKPKLAICTYHNNHHIYEVPKLMKEYNPQYKLYMRYNGNYDSALVSEFVTFAI